MTTDALAPLPPDVRHGLEKAETPAWIQPMLATLVHDTFSRDDWMYERKLDGERCLAVRRHGHVHLLSRNHKELDDTWPEVKDALEAQDLPDFVLDGEVVAFEGNVTSFARLQGRLGIHDAKEARKSPVAVKYYLFDVPWADGYDLREVALRHRKAVLRRLLRFEDPLRFTPHRNGEGEAYLREACEKGWEGLIAKDATGTYVAGRSKKWLKFKCANEQEFVVAGYTDSEAGPKRIGALVLGVYDGGDLVYAGRVGTGFDDEQREELYGKLSSNARKSSPFADDVPHASEVHFTTPKLVVQVAFTEWTSAGRLRHPRFLGIRRDKAPKDVHRERAKRVEV